MSTFNLTEFGVQDLNTEEMKNTDGGIAPILLAFYATDVLMAAFAVGAVNGWNNAAR